MQKKKFLILFLAITLCFPTIIFAETIILKSGETIEGKLIERTDKYIKIDFEGVTLTYYLDEIEKIEEGKETVPDTYSYYFKHGTILLKKRLYDDAIKELQEATKIDAKQAGAFNNLGVAYACKGEYDKAIESLQRAQGNEVTDYITIIKYNLAAVYTEAGLLDKAGEIVDQVKNNKLTMPLMTIMATKEKGGKATNLIAASSSPADTIDLAPGIPDITKYKDNIKEMEKTGDKYYVVENFPLLFFYHSPLSYINLAIGALNDKRFDLANRYLHEAYTALEDKENILSKAVLNSIYFYQGEINLEENDYLGAAQNFEKAVRIFPEFEILHRNLGIAYFKQGDFIKAKSAFSKALVLASNDANETKEIKAYMDKIAGMQPSNVQSIGEKQEEYPKESGKDRVAYNRGREYAQVGKLDQAISELTEAISLSKSQPNPAYYAVRANVYLAKKDYENAISDMTSVIDITKKKLEFHPDDPNLKQLVAVGYIERGKALILYKKLDQAVADFNEALSFEPNNPEIYYWRGYAYASYDDLEKTKSAVGDLTDAINLNPNYAEAYEKRAYLFYMVGGYDQSWKDVHKVEELGAKITPEFRKELERASGRRE